MRSASTGAPAVLPWQQARNPSLYSARHSVSKADQEIVHYTALSVFGALALVNDTVACLTGASV